MADLSSLIRELEGAKAGSMGLSRQIAKAVGWINRGNSLKGEWFHPNDTRDGHVIIDGLHGTEYSREPPDFTRSVDAALTLVPEGWDWDVGNGVLGANNKGPFWSTLSPPNGRLDQDDILGGGSTPAVALCIAALKARSVSREARPEKKEEAAAVDTPGESHV